MVSCLVNRNRLKLVDNGDFQYLRDYMLQYNVFFPDEVETMESKGERRRIMSACVDRLYQKPPEVIMKFFKVLREADKHLHDQLDLRVPTIRQPSENSEDRIVAFALSLNVQPQLSKANSRKDLILSKNLTKLTGQNEKVYDYNNDERSDVKVTIMRKSSELQGYEHRRENKLMQYFNAVGIEETGQFIHLRVYQIHRLDFVKTERTYNLGNVIKKSKNNYWIVRDSTIGLTGSSCENFEVAKLNCPLLPEDESGFRTLEEALESYERSTVTVKVAQVSPVKYRDNFLAIRSLSAKDSSNKTVKIDLFGNHAEKNYAKNDVVKLTSVYKKVYRNRIQLSLSKTSDVQFMPPESLQIAIGDDDYLSDSDFEDTPLDTFKITECLGCHIYNCCDKPACYEKKLNDDGTCRTCAERPERQMKTCRATFKYLTEASRSPIQITLFKPTLSILLQENVDLTSWDTFETQIANALPICFKCKISEGKFYNITMQ